MKRSSSKIAPSRKSAVVLDSVALGRIRGGLVSNFNLVKLPSPDSDYNPDVAANDGPIAMW
jgi:hypothetical protein